ncbi:unnamed protein product [Schistocephalus solidus]|uniref:Endonuclease/exonuclease/phosphatase domain-containing protein n=1 Tax=Schistocephalus solidus TaxID=70667 RepID=A0A183SUT1_SCHSO|nr:unnamed protein product [Schistocephalus solidus]
MLHNECWHLSPSLDSLIVGSESVRKRPGRKCECRARLADHKIRDRKNQKNNNTPSPSLRHTLRAARVSPLTLAAWNIRSLLDNPRCKRPERRTALVAREMARYKVEIAALSETRFSEQGQLEEVGAGYTLFWSGRPKAERRDAGVAFAIRNDIVGRLPCLPQGINDRLMGRRLPVHPPGDCAEGGQVNCGIYASGKSVTIHT